MGFETHHHLNVDVLICLDVYLVFSFSKFTEAPMIVADSVAIIQFVVLPSFLPSDSFPHVFCPQILPLPLPSFFALNTRAKKEGKGNGKI